MEIRPGIHLIKESLSPVFDDQRCWTSILLIISDDIAIIDTGVPGSTSNVILPYLDRIGLQVTDIDFIVNTHGHGDHIGSNESLRRLSGARLLIHTGDASKLEHGAAWGTEPIPPHRADRMLSDGDIVNLGKRQFKVIHLPGHSEGSIGLYESVTRTLISGDSLQGLGTTIQNFPLIFDPDAYERSVDRASELAIDHLIPAHPYFPLTDTSHTEASGAAGFLRICRQFNEQVDDCLLAITQNLVEPVTVEFITDRLTRAFGMPNGTRLGAISTYHYLERLRRRELVHAAGSGPNRTYRAV